jgi:hypothetical protein
VTAYCSPPARPKSDGLATGGWPGWLVVLVHGLPPRQALQFEPMLALHAVLAAVRGLLAAIEETAHQSHATMSASWSDPARHELQLLHVLRPR